MRKRYAPLGIASALLVVASVIFVVGGLEFYREYQREFPDWASDTGPCGALITWSPPSVLYTGLYVNQPSLLTLRYRSPQPQSLSISVSIPQFTQQQSIQVKATPDFQSLTFKPPLLNGVLDALVGPGQRAAELHLDIENSSSVVCNISANIELKSRLWMLWQDAANGTDNARYLAGWVTPDAKAISMLIGRTNQWIANNPTKYPGLTELVGYDDNASPSLVIEEVDAIFDTLQFEYRVRYTSDNILDLLRRRAKNPVAQRYTDQPCSKRHVRRNDGDHGLSGRIPGHAPLLHHHTRARLPWSCGERRRHGAKRILGELTPGYWRQRRAGPYLRRPRV